MASILVWIFSRILPVVPACKVDGEMKVRLVASSPRERVLICSIFTQPERCLQKKAFIVHFKEEPSMVPFDGVRRRNIRNSIWTGGLVSYSASFFQLFICKSDVFPLVKKQHRNNLLQEFWVSRWWHWLDFQQSHNHLVCLTLRITFHLIDKLVPQLPFAAFGDLFNSWSMTRTFPTTKCCYYPLFSVSNNLGAISCCFRSILASHNCAIIQGHCKSVYAKAKALSTNFIDFFSRFLGLPRTEYLPNFQGVITFSEVDAYEGEGHDWPVFYCHERRCVSTSNIDMASSSDCPLCWSSCCPNQLPRRWSLRGFLLGSATGRPWSISLGSPWTGQMRSWAGHRSQRCKFRPI